MDKTVKKKTWNELVENPYFTVSASAIEMVTDYNNGCWRKWWLTKIRKIQTPAKGSTTLGDAFHNVAERFLSADDLGRDPETGNPMEMFPEGWTEVRSRFDDSKISELTMDDAGLVKRLFEIGVTKGILQRSPGREIEKEIRQKIGDFVVPCRNCDGTGNIGAKPCPKCNGTGKRTISVSLYGFVDLVEPNAIIDHKTCKLKRYAKSKAKLKKDPQLNIYGFAVHCGSGKDEEIIRLRHNQFFKTEVDARETTAEITKGELRTFWSSVVLPTVKRMAETRERARSWSDLPEPTNPRACQAYGGCPFVPLCSGQVTESEIEKRFKKQIEAVDNSSHTDIVVKSKPLTDKEGATNMSLFDSIRAGAPSPIEPTPTPETSAPESKPEPIPEPVATTTGTGTGSAFDALRPKVATQNLTPQVPQVPKEPVEVASVQEEIKSQTIATAPWFQEGCMACKDNPIQGMSTNGNPCAICIVGCKQKGIEGPDDYTIGSDEQGNPIFELKNVPEPIEMQVSTETVIEETVTAEVKEAITPEGDVTLPPEPKPEPVVEEPPAPAPKTRKKVEDDKDPSFILLINCTRVKGAKALMACDVFKGIRDGLLEATGKDYYDLDPFKRRDEIAKMAKDIVAEFKGKTICATGFSNSGDDYNSFVKAIMPFASSIVQGLE